MAFTTWTALYGAMLDDYATGGWRHKTYSFGGDSFTFASFAEFKEQLEYAKRQAEAESGTRVRRVYAKPGGRG